MGIIAKIGETNKVHVAVSDLLTSGPKPGVSLKVYTYQHTLIGSGSTDGDGFARIEVQGRPFLLVAQDGADYGYVRLDDGNAESVSMFQVEGQNNPDQTKGFIYGERGVWRPGDSIYLQFVLQDKHKQLPADHPIVMEWYNPRAQLVSKQVGTYNTKAIHDFRLNTNLQDPTGNWRAVVKVGNNVF